jgi:methylenetetrahydrofolate reductase (NADPH)
MSVNDLKEKLVIAKNNGISNILALRGDPPQGSENWKSKEDGLSYSKDLVELIRKEHGDYFGICVAGYPEGHPDGSYETDLKFLKEKVDAGADYIITQLFYDCDAFLKFCKDAKAIGINCPILPGIMPIHSYNGFKRMVSFCKTKIPEHIEKELSEISVDDEEAVKAYGIKLGISMSRYLLDNGVQGIHFYTLNLEKTATEIVRGLGLAPKSIPKSLPWKTSTSAKRKKEDVRPIYWSNRPTSYLQRTSSWDEFPNGRWGDSRSPAFGDFLGDYHLTGEEIPKEKKMKSLGKEHKNIQSIYQVFIDFLEGKTNYLPWADDKSEEIKGIEENLIKLNKNGFLTINSQPKVNCAKSDDPIHGWGAPNGYVFQKAYVEFFCSPENATLLMEMIKDYPTMTYEAVNHEGKYFSNSKNSINAVTWGVFPDSEIKQPTIVEKESFLSWKNEAFHLWSSWADIYEKNTESRGIIEFIHDNFYLINIVDNDFVDDSQTIFSFFEEVTKQIK